MGGDVIEPREGVLEEILRHLPLKSLIRFKGVSKSWYALITSLHIPQQVSLVRDFDNEETGKSQRRFSFYPPLDAQEHYPCLDTEQYVEIEGHSHGGGTVCFSTVPEYKVFLYTPATGHLLQLPPSILLFPRDVFGNDAVRMGCNDLDASYGEQELPIRSEMISIGFGYDSKSRDFKVVRVVGFGINYFLTRRAEVYESGKHEWREIITNSPIPDYYCMVSNRCFDQYYQGFFYWWGVIFNTEPLTEIIFWFDMSEEVFGHIPMPEVLNFPTSGTKHGRRSLGFLNGTMVLLYSPFLKNHPGPPFFVPDEVGFDVWGMSKDYDNHDKVLWSKLFTIGPLFGVHKPLAFVTSDQLLIETYDGQFILYNIYTKHSKHIPIKGSLSYFDICRNRMW